MIGTGEFHTCYTYLYLLTYYWDLSVVKAEHNLEYSKMVFIVSSRVFVFLI